jgi:hypothetical protein
MALSMDEQRMLAEIERRLAAEDPGLAACLTSFRRPGPAMVLRSPRARIVGSLFTVLLVAMVSLMVYAMIPFRTHAVRPPDTNATATVASSRSTLSATAPGGQLRGTQQPSASARPGAKASAGAPGKAASTAGGTQAAGSAASGRPASQAP